MAQLENRQMRDIREDIKERIAAAQAEMKRLEEELEKVEYFVADLAALLEAEEDRFRTIGGPANAPEPPTEEMDKFILRLVKRQPQSKPDIGEAVQKAGYIKPGQAAGRVVHGKLLGMIKDKSIRVRSDKKYEIYQ